MKDSSSERWMMMAKAMEKQNSMEKAREKLTVS